MATCSWPLGNGHSLEFTIYSCEEKWNKVAGLYIFSYQASSGRWHPLYVGQTNDFSARLPSHERLATALRRGATHIHALAVPLQEDRDALESMLIRHLQPVMNEQLR